MGLKSSPPEASFYFQFDVILNFNWSPKSRLFDCKVLPRCQRADIYPTLPIPQETRDSAKLH